MSNFLKNKFNRTYEARFELKQFLIDLLIVVLAVLCIWAALTSYSIFEKNWSDLRNASFARGAFAFVLIIFALIVSPSIFLAIKIIIKYITILTPAIYFGIRDLPETVRHETQMCKEVWEARGFSKYTTFGGFLFYLKLRQRILAFFLLGISVSIFVGFFIYKQVTHEKTFWKHSFYAGERPEPFVFKANKPYSIEADIKGYYAVYLNGKKHVVTDNPMRNDEYYQTNLRLPKNWWIIFPETTVVIFDCYSGFWNDYISQTIEVTEGEAIGRHVTTGEFEYRWEAHQRRQELEKQYQQENKKNKKKKRK